MCVARRCPMRCKKVLGFMMKEKRRTIVIKCKKKTNKNVKLIIIK